MRGMGKSRIPYADYSWNPVTGCRPDFDCWQRCWARAMHTRFHPSQSFSPTYHPEVLGQPLHTRRPGVVAVSFGGDLFAEGVEDKWIGAVFGIMSACMDMTFLVLTKRPERMRLFLEQRGTHSRTPMRSGRSYRNVLLGTSVCNQADVDARMPHLAHLAATGWRTWVSVEPLLDWVDLSWFLENRPIPVTDDVLDAPDGSVVDGRERTGLSWECIAKLAWVVCGAESGPGARFCDIERVHSLRDQCIGVPFFFKQASALYETREEYCCGKWVRLPVLNGHVHAAMPEAPR